MSTESHAQACVCSDCIQVDVDCALSILEENVVGGMPCGGEVAQRLLDLLGRLTDVKELDGPNSWNERVKRMLS